MSISITALADIQTRTVAQWHVSAIVNEWRDFEALVIGNHEINFRLWHEEDQARDPAASDSVIAGVKRRIDQLNQQRSDSIEQLDNAIADALSTAHALSANSHRGAAALPMNTETPGSTLDRLSILALRLFHLTEQSQRVEITDPVRERVIRSLQIATQQRSNLIVSSQQLIDDLFTGRKRHQAFRHLKMYNDPELNPAIYKAQG